MIRLLLLFAIVKAFNFKHYYSDPRIHSIGNHGPLGKIHAPTLLLFSQKSLIKLHIMEEILEKKLLILITLMIQYLIYVVELDFLPLIME